MSCDWDVYCVDCKSHLGVGDCNHGDAYMRQLVAVGPQLGKFAVDAKAIRMCTEVSFEPSIVGAYRFDLDWFAIHGEHHLAPIDEYGRLDAQCWQHVVCECGHKHACKLNKGHEGPCNGRPGR